MVKLGKLEFKNLNKDFEDVKALTSVNGVIESGEFISLIGPSGCGKSTLLRLIAGLEEATEGEILLDEEKIEGPGSDRGFVFQEATLYPWLTVEKNIAFGLKIKDKKLTDEHKQEVQDIIKLVGLEGFEKSYPHQLSGGMQQRVSLARGLINKPKVLLFDEPFGALDAFTRIKMHSELLKIWQERKTTMIMVTHDVEEAVVLSDRIFAMTPRPGKIKEIIDVNLAHPRNRDGAEFISYKEQVLRALDFTERIVE